LTCSSLPGGTFEAGFFVDKLRRTAMSRFLFGTTALLSSFFLGLPAQAAPPIIAPGGIVNAASYVAGPIVAGSLTAIFGVGLASSTASSPGTPLPSTLNNVSVTMNGTAVPLLFVSPSQINAQVPWSLSGTSQVQVVVMNENGSSLPVSANLADVAPAIFTADGKQAVAYMAATRTYTFNPGQTSRIARPGEYLRIYATGLGPVNNTPSTGAAPDSTLSVAPTLSTSISSPSVTIGGVAAVVSFAGLAPQGINPDYAGVYEVDAQIPLTAPAGPAVAVTLSTNGVNSNTATIPIDSTPAPLLAKWVQLGPNGAIARAITSQPACPSVSIDGKSQSMQVRSQPSLPFYPVTSCEIALPAATTFATLDEDALPLPKKGEYTKIVVIGDTGCRLDTSGTPAVYQACNDPNAWPVAKIAANAAAAGPELIVMTGDYHYREAPCAHGNAGCAGSPWNYNWDVWYADLFSQVQPAFNAAPMFFIRGNHETCDRAGDGWFRYLDPRPFPGACQAYTDPFAVIAGSLQLIHVDSAVADDNDPIADQITAYQPQFGMVRQMATGNAWLLTHRPLWTIRAGSATNVVMQNASNNSLPDGIQMVLSGHTHIFQTYTFDPNHAPQVVIGNGGDVLNAVVLASTLLGKTTGNAQIVQATSQTHFGFSTVSSTSSGWTIVDHAVDGSVVTTCQVADKAVSCDK
jgi:uncharacterized protein (TIGR03437 family)